MSTQPTETLNQIPPEPPKFSDAWCDWRRQYFAEEIAEFVAVQKQKKFAPNARSARTDVKEPAADASSASVNVSASRLVKFDNLQIADMPEAVLDGRLGEVCEKMVNGSPKHPRAYAYPALLGVAAVMYPAEMLDYQQSLVTAGKMQTNLFTALIGEIHSGKSQAIDAAVRYLGLPNRSYSAKKSGSPEGLFAQLAKGCAPQLLIDLDEWEHMLKKANIEGSTFFTILNTAFYKSNIDMVIAKGRQLTLHSELSFIGGIVEKDYGELLGSGSNGGFSDRLLQGRCPTGFKFNYREADISAVDVNWVPVKVDGSVWDVKQEWDSEFPNLGREAEIAIRCARICASADGRTVLYGKDMQPARALLIEQRKIRQALAPNVGDTPDAIICNSILKVLPQDGAWVTVRDLDKRVHSERLGAGVFRRALENLQANQRVEVFDSPRMSPSDFHRVGVGHLLSKTGKKPKLVRRIPEL